MQNLATFLSLFDVKFWLCSTNATDAPQLDLDWLKLLEVAKTKVRDPNTKSILGTSVNVLCHWLCLAPG